jgi:hypothetical protein
MLDSRPSHGLGKSFSLAIGFILIVGLCVLVFFTQAGSQDIRGRAADEKCLACRSSLYPEQCLAECAAPTPINPCASIPPGYNRDLCERSEGVTSGAQNTPTSPPVQTTTPKPKPLAPGSKCGNDCYRACDGGVGWDGVCKSRENYCKALKNPSFKALKGLSSIGCD